MKITAIKLHTLAHPTLTQAGYRLKQTSGLRRIQYTHIPLSTTTPMRMQILDVETDEGITGRIAPASISKHQLDILKTHAVGESPFARERLFQMLHKGTRWVYQEPGWFGDFDNCLWDIAAKAAGLPVYALVGRMRDRLPVYLTDHELTPQGYLDHIERGPRLRASTPTNCTPTGAARPISPCSPRYANPWATTTTCSTIPSAHTTCAKRSRWGGRWRRWTTSGSKSRCTNRR